MIIEVIIPQPMTSIEVAAFRSVPEGIDLVSNGDGDKYLSDDGTYKPLSGGGGGTSDYNDLINKPTLGTASPLNVSTGPVAASNEVVKGNDTRLTDSRTPLTHTHIINDTTGLQAALDNKQPLSTILTNTTASYTTALNTKLNGLATVASSGLYSDLTGNPTLGTASSLNVPVGTTAASGEVVKGNDLRLSDARTPTAHSHVISDVTGLQTALDSKQATLVSGTNLKTLSTRTLLGSGDIVFPTINGFNFFSGININNNTDLTVDQDSPSQVTISSSTGTAAALSAVGSTQSGIVTPAQWTTWNAKQSALSGTGFVKSTSGTISYDNSSYYLASNPSSYTANTGTVTTASVVTANGFSGSVANSTTTPAFTLTLQDATTSQSGKLTSADWNTFNSKQAALGFTPYNATNPSGYTSNTGTVTNLSIATANGFSGSVATSTTTPAVTLTLQNATASQSGQLTSTDWNTFNTKDVAPWQKMVFLWTHSTSTNGNMVGTTYTGNGSYSTGVPTATGNIWAGLARSNYANLVTTTNQVLGVRISENIFHIGSVSGKGGFIFRARFGAEVWNNSGRLFAGICSNTSLVVTVNPSTNNNSCGFCVDDTDSGLISFLTRNGTTSTKASTGLTIATGSAYDVEMICPSNGTAISWSIREINTLSNTAVTGSASSNLPVSTTMMGSCVLASNAALTTATAVQIGVSVIYVQTDY